MPDKIIAYPNRTAQYQDEFWYDMALPWLYEHWWVIPLVIGGLWLYFKIANRKRY